MLHCGVQSQLADRQTHTHTHTDAYDPQYLLHCLSIKGNNEFILQISPVYLIWPVVCFFDLDVRFIADPVEILVQAVK